MALFDIIDEITEKQIVKTETGDNRIFGVVIGIVTDNYDVAMKGRVCVNIPVRDVNANNLKWARVAMPSSGKKWGHYFLPEIGDQVLVAFEQGNIEKPYIIGCVPRSNDRFLTQSVDEKNELKRIVTKNGNTLEFKDAAEGEGTKDVISMYTPKNEHQIILDNEKKKILISDKKGDNCIDIRSEAGKMIVRAKENLTVEVGDSIKITMNASTGTVKLDCKKLKVEASEGTNVETSGNMKFSGGNVGISASAALKAESSGTTNISGAAVTIG
ncbi:MAG: hypothetical protein IJ040_03885 [Lachnospiraceae bacterium]|nr:hypothetical protein [Lachnospiraceae bacterium]